MSHSRRKNESLIMNIKTSYASNPMQDVVMIFIGVNILRRIIGRPRHDRLQKVQIKEIRYVQIRKEESCGRPDIISRMAETRLLLVST